MSSFSYKSKLFPGQRINIIAGLAVNDNSTDNDNSIFKERLSDGFKAPIDQIISKTDPESCFFGPFPILTPCQDWTALIEAFFAPYTVNGRPSSFAAAAALQSHSPKAEEIRKDIANRLGIKLEDANDQVDRGFILVRIPRQIPQNKICLSAPEHQLLWNSVLSDCSGVIDGLKARLQLADVDAMTSPDAVQNALNVMQSELGTHIVESISVGDEVFQVFVYSKENFKKICSSMDKSGWEGVKALSFRYFTSPNYLLYCTTPTLASNDTSFSYLLQLLEDKNYGVKASIFNLLLNEQAQEKSKSISTLTCVAANCVSVTTGMVPRELMATDKTSSSALICTLIDTVAIQSAITKFGAEGCGSSAVLGDASIPYAKIYEPFTTSVPISMLWSPYVSLTQPYVQLGDFWNSTSIDKSGVRHLAVVADVIEVEDSIDLSSLTTVILTCRLLIAGKDGGVPTLKLSSSAWEPLKLYCGSMSGTCAFEVAGKPESRRVVFDPKAISLTPDDQQVSYDDFFGGKYPVKLFSDFSSAADVQWQKDTLQSGLETLLLSATAVLRPQAILSPELKQTAMEAWKCHQWISGYLREIVDSFNSAGTLPPQEVASLYSLSVILSRSVIDPRTPTEKLIPQVPSLRYTAYQDAVTRLLNVAETYASKIDQANQAMLNYSLELQREFREEQRDSSIRKMAQFMVDQNEAFAKNEDDLTTSHNEIINHNDENILVLNQREKQIKSQYYEYLQKLEDAKKNISDAIEEEIQKQEVKMSIEFIWSLAEVLGDLASGIYGFKALGDAKDAERTLKQWESFLKIAEATSKMIETVEKLDENIRNVIDLDNSTPNSFAKPPTDTDWEIFMNDTEAQVRPAEEFIKPEVEKYIAAVRNLTTIAKSLNVVIQQRSQLENNIFAEKSSRNVSMQQAARLRTLKLNLQNPSMSPSVDYVADIGRFAAVFQQRQNCVLNKMAEIAMLQDDSMTYHYLSKPSLITKFDISAIQENLAAQALSAIRMLETYPYPPTDMQKPVEVKAELVSVCELMSDTGITINVAPTFGLFNSMARVRINSVDVRVDGATTDGGQCHVQMISAGMPMVDRGLNREPLTYKMISREWHVVYDIASDKTIIGTQPAKEWDAFFTKPTPFQSWNIKLPKTSENAGLRFAAQTTTVSLRFNVEIMYSTPPQKMTHKMAGPHLLTANANSDPSEFLSLLKGCSITDGWDVVSFVSVDRINDLWKQRWQAETDAAFGGDRMFIQDIDITHSQPLPGNIQVDYHLLSKAGPPLLTFVADDKQSALVSIPLIDGKLTTTTYIKGEKSGEETRDIQSSSAQPVMVKTKAALKALPGNVDNFHAVHIDPKDGVFAFENIELDPQVDAGFCSEISEYFKKQKLQPWLIGSLRFTAEQDYLQPKTFRFQTYTPPDTHQQDWPSILGIYVLTTTPTPPNHGMRQIWPEAAWPVSSDFDGAVYFSANLLWNKEILQEVQKQIGDAKISQDKSTNEYYLNPIGDKALSSHPVTFDKGESNPPWQTAGQATVDAGIKTFPLSSIYLRIQDLTKLDLKCDANWQESLPYQITVYPHSPGEPTVYDVGWDSVTFTCTFDSSTSVHIDKSSFDVTFDELTVNPTVTSIYNGTKKTLPWDLLNPEISGNLIEEATKAIQDYVSKIKLTFSEMSLFAVSNLLFPESKTINPSGVYFPGDMVIVGQVTREWIQPEKKVTFNRPDYCLAPLGKIKSNEC